MALGAPSQSGRGGLRLGFPTLPGSGGAQVLGRSRNHQAGKSRPAGPKLPVGLGTEEAALELALRERLSARPWHMPK